MYPVRRGTSDRRAYTDSAVRKADAYLGSEPREVGFNLMVTCRQLLSGRYPGAIKGFGGVDTKDSSDGAGAYVLVGTAF